jgi:hypothetical protein
MAGPRAGYLPPAGAAFAVRAHHRVERPVLTLYGIDVAILALVVFVPAGRGPATRRGPAPARQPIWRPEHAVLATVSSESRPGGGLRKVNPREKRRTKKTRWHAPMLQSPLVAGASAASCCGELARGGTAARASVEIVAAGAAAACICDPGVLDGS